MAQLLLKAFAVCAVVGTVVALPTAEVDTPAQTCTNPSKRRSWYVVPRRALLSRPPRSWVANQVLVCT